MFNSHKHLKRKTPDQGINRQEFIEHLVDEYYTTTNVEAQEQVTANLANFAYDPINWEYLKIAQALKLFVELLDSTNEKLQLHGTSGLCNICLDQKAFSFIVKPKNINIIRELLLKTQNVDIILNILTLLYQLLSSENNTKFSILNAQILKQINNFKTVYATDQRIINIASLLIEEYGQRYEFIEIINTKLPANDQKVE